MRSLHVNNIVKEDQRHFNRKHISNFANVFSFLCSVAGTGLIAVICFGPTNTMDYRNIQVAIESAGSLLIAAVVSGVLAFVLSILKKSSNQPKPVLIQSSAKEDKLLEDNLNLFEGSDNTARQLIDSKITLNSSENGQLQAVSAEATKTMESTRLNPNTSINSLGQLEPSKDSLANIPKVKSSVPSHCGKVQHPIIGNELVPFQKRNASAFNQCSMTEIIPHVPSSWNFSSTDKFCNSPVAEIISTRKLTFFAEGNIQCQEEFQVKRTFSRNPVTQMSSCRMLESNINQLNAPEFSKRFMPLQGVTQTQKNQFSDVITKFEYLNF